MFKSIAARITRIGAYPDEPENIELARALHVISTLLQVGITPIWIAIYFVEGELITAGFMVMFTILSFANVLILYKTRAYSPFCFIQQLLNLLTPFIMTITLGGFSKSSAIIMIAGYAPLTALVFGTPRIALRWFAGFLMLMVASGVLPPYLPFDSTISSSAITFLFIMNLSAPTIFAITILYLFVLQRDEAYQLLAVEQEKSEGLLLNILPKQIADILKNEEGVIADRYENASIMFAELSGFTPMSAQMQPEEMIALLNKLYSHFDSLAEKYGVEKIRTIGDNYMVASGVPSPRPDHAQALAGMALDVLLFCSSLPPPEWN